MNEIVIKKDLRDKAQSIFGDLHNARHVVEHRESGAVSVGRLYAHISGKKDEQVDQLIRQDLSVRRVYKTLLQQSASFYIPQALAASSEDFPERHSNGCTLRLQKSRAENDQVYLIIEMTDQRRSMPKTLSVFAGNSEWETLDLPDARNGVIQTIIDKKSSLAKLLADPKTEVFLR